MYIIYEGNKFKKISESSSEIKNRKLIIKSEIVEEYKKMDEDFEQNYYSLKAEGVLKKRNGENRLLNWLAYYVNYYEIVNFL